jgi:hypothetical protein
MAGPAIWGAKKGFYGGNHIEMIVFVPKYQRMGVKFCAGGKI